MVYGYIVDWLPRDDSIVSGPSDVISSGDCMEAGSVIVSVLKPLIIYIAFSDYVPDQVSTLTGGQFTL